MADHICSPVPFPWGRLRRASWSSVGSTGLAGTELVGEEPRPARGDSTVPWMYIHGKHCSRGMGLVPRPCPWPVAAQRSIPESIPVPRVPAHGSADALRAARHLAGPQGLRNKELLAELSAAPGRSLTCRYRAVAQAGLSQRLGILELRTEGSDII